MAAMLPPELHGAAVEILPYFADSFGNSTRIDYGTGHEANFVAWLLCLVRIQFLAPTDYHALAAKVFSSYLSLMRDLQTTYWLEPAGSHGVWGLDDYHFIPFILGASQLIGHKYMKPKSIHNATSGAVLQGFRPPRLHLVHQAGEERGLHRALPHAQRHQRRAQLGEGQ